VVDSLRQKGAVFVEELDEIPDAEAPVIFSAHGVPKAVPADADRRKLIAIDATCPLVTKVHLEAVRYAREGGVPFFGICLGMQCAVIEYARHVCGLAGANSSEFDPGSPHRVIDLLPEQRALAAKGGTMRLGVYPIVLAEGSAASRLYGQGIIQERHRHRYEVNNDYLHALEKNGLQISGVWAEKQLVELIEIPEHPFFVAGQFHPEFRSRPWDPHPLFAGFVAAALARGARG
jgi:CTP synthase